MNINFTTDELSNVLDALDLAIQSALHEIKFMNGNDKTERQKEVGVLSDLQTNILRQRTANRCVSVAVEVKGGLVQNIYSNEDVSAEVYDLDVSDFSDEGEEETAISRTKELEELVSQPEWKTIW